MKTKVRILVIGVIVICLAGIYSIIDKNISIYDTKCDTSMFQSLVLEKDKEVVQNFVCEEASLDGISIKIATDDTIDNGKVVLSYYLTEQSSKKKVVKGEVNLAKLQSGRYFKIKFPTVENTLNKEYRFHISLKQGEESNVRMFYTPGKDEKAPFFYNDKQVKGIEVMRTITHRFDLETFFITICFVVYIVMFMKWLYKLFK